MAFTYSQVTALSNKLIKDKVDPGIFSGESIIKDLRERQEVEDGGSSITCPLIIVDDTGSVGGFYSSGGALSLQAVDSISSAEVDWRFVYESMTVTKPDLAKNGASKQRQLNLLTAKVKAMSAAFKQRLTKAALSSGGNDAGGQPQFDGAALLTDVDTTSYAGISSSDLSVWLPQSDSNSGTNRSLTLAIFDGVQDLTREGDIQGATHAYARAQVFSQFKGLLNAFQRTKAEESLSGFGHKGERLSYAGLEVCVENQCPSNTLYLLDMNNWRMSVQKDGNFRKETLSTLETQDALVQRVFLYANIISGSRRAHGEILDISE